MSKFNWKNGTLTQNARVNVEGTMYDVEPASFEGETPLSAENLNAMQDGIYEDINAINMYSSTEKVVGTWFGKPMYRSVFELKKGVEYPSSYTSYVAYTHNINNIKTIVNLHGIIKGSNPERFRHLPFAFGGSSIDASWFCGLAASTTQLICEMGSGIYNDSQSITIVIEYTKTTD